MMRVRATRRGYLGDLLRRPGDVFTLARPEDFSDGWMVAVPDETPESRTSAPHALTADRDHRSPIGPTRRVCVSVDPDEDRAVDFDFDPFT